MTTPEEILSYWLDELGEAGWYAGGEAIDTQIRKLFGPAHAAARAGSFGLWLTYPAGTLAYLILTDQMSRNMFRGTGAAFSTDLQARNAARIAIERGWDMRIDEPARQFFYMPFEHSECLTDQDRCVRLMSTRMTDADGALLLHARAHREIIRRFGRFPFRNEALGRNSTAAELQFMAEGGYGGLVASFKAEAA